MFVRLAERLAAEAFTVVRFSVRGHGKSGGSQRGVTIAGEMLDLDAAISNAAGPLAIIAASFGAVVTTLSLPCVRQLRSLRAGGGFPHYRGLGPRLLFSRAGGGGYPNNRRLACQKAPRKT
jgi:predicted alpha/beta hydrolase